MASVDPSVDAPGRPDFSSSRDTARFGFEGEPSPAVMDLLRSATTIPGAGPTVGLFGTFSVDNYGDLLFPVLFDHLIGRHLPGLRTRLFSPFSGRCRLDGARVAAVDELEADGDSLDGFVVGGGDIIRFDTAPGDDASSGYAPLAIAPALLASVTGKPVVWNAPGLPFELTTEQSSLLQAVLQLTDYASVRDERSRDFLSGASNSVVVVPDIGFLIAEVFPGAGLVRVLEDLRSRFSLPDSYVVFHLSAATALPEQFDQAAGEMETACRRVGLPALLLPLGPVHGETADLERLRHQCPDLFHLAPAGLHPLEIAALIAGAAAFVGTSLHGNITAFAYEVPSVPVNPRNLAKLHRFGELTGRPVAAAWNEVLEHLERSMSSAGVDGTGQSHRRSIRQMLHQHGEDMARGLSRRPRVQTGAAAALLKLCHNLIRHERRPIDGSPKTDPTVDAYVQSLVRLVRSLQERLHEIESTRWWRMRLSYDRWRRSLSRVLPRRGVIAWLQRLMLPASPRARRMARRALARVLRKLYLWLEEEPVVIVRRDHLAASSGSAYDRWRALNMPRPIDLSDYRDRVPSLQYRPTISILLPVFNPHPAFLEAALQSVVAQVYPDWELCIADDASTDPEVGKILQRFAAADPRIKVKYRDANGHISAATNSTLELATGEFCALFDHDDLLTPDALFQNVLALNRDPELDLIYSDEDKVDEGERCFGPHFKPQWSPDKLLSGNYVCHLAVIRTALLRGIGGMRVGFEGAQDHDLFLRLTEKTQRIHHIPRVLYHWRSHAGSTAHSMASKPYARTAAFAAVTEAMERRGEGGTVHFLHESVPHFLIRYDIVQRRRVSVVIPTRSQAGVLTTCLASILAQTEYADFEVLVLDNGSEEEATRQLLDDYRRRMPDRFRVLRVSGPFNFSRLMNRGAAETRGTYLLFLNNDTEVTHPDWLDAMVEQAQRPSVGCVGAQLLYPNGTIQHAGVVLGPESPTTHVWRGRSPLDQAGFDRLQSVNNYSAVTAACLMVRRAVFDEIGGFDEALAVNFNDVDFCLRVREAGYHNLYLPHVRLYHHEGLTRGHPLASTGSASQHDGEIERFTRRWSHYLQDDPCWSRHLQPCGAEIRSAFVEDRGSTGYGLSESSNRSM